MQRDDRRYRLFEKTAAKHLARYIIRACFSQQRVVYIPKDASDRIAKVIYSSKNGQSQETFDALEWLAQLVVYITGSYEHTVRYYGYYSNKSRGLRKKAWADDTSPRLCPLERHPRNSGEIGPV